MKIEKPTWMLENRSVGTEYFLDWFDAVVGPMNKILAEGVEIYGDKKYGWIDRDNRDCKDKALLINIRPIKRETKEDFIRDWIAYEECEIKKSGPYVSSHIPDLIKRAKAVLENKGKT